MGMADEVRARQLAELAGKQRREAEEARNLQEFSERISRHVPEFIASARELGIKPKGGNVLSRYWGVSLRFASKARADDSLHSRYVDSVNIKVNPNGTWRWVQHAPSTHVIAHYECGDQAIVEAFTFWLKLNDR